MQKPGDSALPVAEKRVVPARPAGRVTSRQMLLYWLAILTGVAYLCAPHVNKALFSTIRPHQHPEGSHRDGQCAQPPALFPSGAGNPGLRDAFEQLSTEKFRNASIARLAGAVRVRTESFDDLGPIGEDPRWEVMADFRAYLRATFPRLHASLKVETVNTHGLLYTWAGSDPSLKPTLLMAHQDTVPVPLETVPEWTHPPFSGYYDGEFIWGRGASDCKNQLIGAMEAVETLLDAGFGPRRTILLSFGFDEECSGLQGASALSAAIRERYGEDGIAVIVDEGPTFEKVWETVFAKPGAGEKGYFDVYATVRLPGGHSSIPTDHTSIGVLSEFITLVEAEPYKLRLDDANPYLEQLQCGAVHSPAFPGKLKKLLDKREPSDASSLWGFLPRFPEKHCSHRTADPLALEAARLGGPSIQYLMQTSQAVDIVSGGVKVNALPEFATATINHRINVGEDYTVIEGKLTRLAHSVATRHNLTLHAFEEDPSAATRERSTDAEARSLTLRARRAALPVAPVTPSAGSATFGVLAGTTRALYGEDVVVTPGIMTGNTDTRYYWSLTRHIFRFGPGFDPAAENGFGKIHTVDEKVSVTAHVNAVRWFVLFVRNMDEAELE